MKSYFTLFLRLLQKNRLFAFINLAGLTAGMVCVTLIVMFIRDEWSYDRLKARGRADAQTRLDG